MSCDIQVENKPVETRLTDFTLVTPVEVVKLIKQSPTKSCSLDAVPTSLVKECASTLAPAVANLVNFSLQLEEPLPPNSSRPQ